MKVGGNDAATKYFQSNGGSAALTSKDPKTKYQSTTAVKYKEELKRRVAEDSKLYYLLPFSNGQINLTHSSDIPRRLWLKVLRNPLLQ